MSIDTLTFAALALLYLLAAFFCCSETALTSVNRTRIRELAEQGSAAARTALRLMENAGSFFATVLLGTNLAHVTITTLTRTLVAALVVNSPFFRHLAELAHVQNDLESVATTLFVTPTLLVFSEIIPKTIGMKRAETMTLLLARPTDLCRILLKPFAAVIDVCTSHITAWMGIRNGKESLGRVSREDLKLLADVAAEEGVIHPEASHLMTSLLELDMTPIGAVMVPRADVHLLPMDATAGDLEALAAETGFTRFPVLEEDGKRIAGLVSLRRFLAELSGKPGGETAPLAPLVERDVLFVPESRTVGRMLADFRKSRQPMAIVRDEAGNFTGVVTVESLLSVLLAGIGELREPGRPMARRISEDTFACDASLGIRELEALLGVRLPDTGTENLGALCLRLFGHQPRKDEKLLFHGHEIRIFKVRKHKVETVLLTRQTKARRA